MSRALFRRKLGPFSRPRPGVVVEPSWRPISVEYSPLTYSLQQRSFPSCSRDTLLAPRDVVAPLAGATHAQAASRRHQPRRALLERQVECALASHRLVARTTAARTVTGADACHLAVAWGRVGEPEFSVASCHAGPGGCHGAGSQREDHGEPHSDYDGARPLGGARCWLGLQGPAFTASRYPSGRLPAWPAHRLDTPSRPLDCLPSRK